MTLQANGRRLLDVERADSGRVFAVDRVERADRGRLGRRGGDDIKIADRGGAVRIGEIRHAHGSGARVPGSVADALRDRSDSPTRCCRRLARQNPIQSICCRRQSPPSRPIRGVANADCRRTRAVELLLLPKRGRKAARRRLPTPTAEEPPPVGSVANADRSGPSSVRMTSRRPQTPRATPLALLPLQNAAAPSPRGGVADTKGRRKVPRRGVEITERRQPTPEEVLPMPKAEDPAPDALSRNPQAKEVNTAEEPNRPAADRGARRSRRKRRAHRYSGRAAHEHATNRDGAIFRRC